MKTTGNILLLYLVMVGGSCIPGEEIPWSDEVWKKGNLHTHSLWSDGDDYPEMIMDWYKGHGYDFVALSDHNTFQEGEKWISVTRSPLRKKAFAKYLSKFGPEWVEFRGDSTDTEVRLKALDEYRSRFEDDNFFILKSEEITSSYENKPIHVNATNLQELVPSQEGNSVAEVMQKAVDAVLEQRERTGVPMIPHINHPNFGWAITPQDLMELEGERFFEVFNGHPAVNNYGNESVPGMEEMWDMVNLDYLAKGKPLIYGLATDDSHNYHLYGTQFSNSGRGWIQVNSVSNDAASIIDAMENGRFYASTGLTLKRMIVNQRRISFEVVPEEGVKYLIQFIGARQGDASTSVLREQSGNSAEYVFEGNELFVRARITSNKLKLTPYQVGDYETAWTQPVIPAR